jgi:hypothetical protein
MLNISIQSFLVKGKIMKFTCLFLFIFISLGTAAQARDKFLQKSQVSMLEQNSVELLAHKLELKKIRKDQSKFDKKKKQIEKKLEREEVRRLKKQLRKEPSLKKNCLRRAKGIEKKRKEHISAWRNYRSNRKAAESLIREVGSINRTNEQHVSQLQDEINTFAKERLKGKLEKYSELERFLIFRSWGRLP